MKRYSSAIRLTLMSFVLLSMVAVSVIPSGQVSAQTSDTCTQTHTVAAGENLYRIGLRYGVSWLTLAQWNNLANANLIYVGQVLCVSGPASGNVGTPPPTTPPPATGGPIVIRLNNPFGPTTEPRIYFPTITLGQKFELFGYNFPANTQVTIGLKTLGGAVYTPYYTAKTDVKGEFYVIVDIPAALRTSTTIAVEARTSTGFFGLNWFYNY
jgi:hypothetical protein